MLYAKVVNLNNGRKYDKERANEYLKIGEIYEVYNVDMGRFHTDIWLNDLRLKGIHFNSVHFNFYKDKSCIEEWDIYSDPDLNPYMELEED